MKGNMSKKNDRTPNEWHQLFEAQRQSGLNQSQFCKQHNITHSAFFNAKKTMGYRHHITR